MTYTLSAGGKVTSSWPVTTRNLFVLVAMDCAALANVTLHARDVVVMVSLRTQQVPYSGEGLDLGRFLPELESLPGTLRVVHCSSCLAR